MEVFKQAKQEIPKGSIHDRHKNKKHKQFIHIYRHKYI